MPLKLSLKPHEKFVVNGAVMVNGDRKAEFVIQNRASILREKDIMQPDEADTPLRRVYFPVQMMYLESAAGGANLEDYYGEYIARMTEFMGAITSKEILAQCVAINRDVLGGQYYRALMTCRKLFDTERKLLNYVSEGLPADA